MDVHRLQVIFRNNVLRIRYFLLCSVIFFAIFFF